MSRGQIIGLFAVAVVMPDLARYALPNSEPSKANAQKKAEVAKLLQRSRQSAQKRDFESAIRHAKDATRLNPGNNRATALLGALYMNYGQTLMRAGRYKEAVTQFKHGDRFLESVRKRRGQLLEVESTFQSYTRYFAACAHSLNNSPEKSLRALESAVDAGWLDIDQMKREPALASIRKSKAFKTLLARLAHRPDVKGYVFHQRGKALIYNGRYAESTAFLRRAVKLQRQAYPESRYPKGHPEVSSTLNDLSIALRVQGDLGAARKIAEEMLAIDRRLYSQRDNPLGQNKIALSLYNLGVIADLEGQLQSSRKFYEQSLKILRRQFPGENAQNGRAVAMNLVGLGHLERKQRRYVEGRKYFTRARAIYRRLYPNGHVDLAWTLYMISCLLDDEGKPAEAVKHAELALSMQRRLFPNSQFPVGHPHLAITLHHIGALLSAQGKRDKARNHFQQAQKMYLGLIESFVAASSEAESLNLIAAFPRMTDDLLSAIPPTDGNKNDSSDYTYIWRTHGLIYLVMARRRARMLGTVAPKLKDVYREYFKVRRRLATLALAPSEPGSRFVAFRETQLRKRTARKEELERILAALLPQFRRELQRNRSRPTELVEKLPKNTAFVHFLAYNHSRQDPKVPGLKGWRSTPKYVAWVVQQGAPIVRVNLGAAAPIDAAVKRWRGAIRNGKATFAATTLRRLVWQPVEKQLRKGTKTIYICPDMWLTGIPWPALPGPTKGSILLEQYTLATVPNGPFLLDQFRSTSDGNATMRPVLVVGDVNYDVGATTSKPSPGASAALPRQSRDPLQREGEPTKWKPLPGTRAEIAALTRLAGRQKTITLTGRQAASNRVLDTLPSVGTAHFATHGFFADSQFRSLRNINEAGFESGRGFLRQDRRAAAARSPLLMTGIVLSGANLKRSVDAAGIPRGDSGILTGESIAALPLHNLNLAVLSACETNVGEVAGGEGVFSLQRAFHVAGARNVVASLWNVDDKATAALMRLFYYNLWKKKQTPIYALRSAQLAVYNNPDQVPQWADTSRKLGKPKKLPKAGTSPPKRATRSKLPVRMWAAFVLSGPGN